MYDNTIIEFSFFDIKYYQGVKVFMKRNFRLWFVLDVLRVFEVVKTVNWFISNVDH